MMSTVRKITLALVYLAASAALVLFCLAMGFPLYKALLATIVGLGITVVAFELLIATVPIREAGPARNGCTCSQFALPHQHTSHRKRSFVSRLMRTAL